MDLGIKASTPRYLARLGCEVLVLPADATAAAILESSPDGVFFSNGPGDPAAAGYAVEAMRGVLKAGLPVFGICLGSQILGRALGLETYKLRYGHRGVNQPVMDLATGRVQVTSHNHGFAAALPGLTPAEDEPGEESRPADGRAVEDRPADGRPARDGHTPGIPRAAGPNGRTSRKPPVSRSIPPTGPRSSATSTSTTVWSRGCGCWTAPSSASSTTLRRPPARTTPLASSTTSPPPWSIHDVHDRR